jgi:hypothetical protein
MVEKELEAVAAASLWPAAEAPRLSGPRPTYLRESERDCAAFFRLDREAYAFPLLVRFGSHFGVTAARIKVGQYLFRAHGGKVVFFGRFIALLRSLAAVLAGVTFLLANAAGAVLWAGAFAIGGFFFGKLLLQLHHAVATGVFIVALVTFFAVGYLIHRYEGHLIEVAECEIPVAGLIPPTSGRGSR